MESISCHVTPLVINSLGADKQSYTDVRTEAILRNQARTCLWPAHAWFKNSLCKVNFGNPLVFIPSNISHPKIINIYYTCPGVNGTYALRYSTEAKKFIIIAHQERGTVSYTSELSS